MTSPSPASVRGSSHPYYASEGCFYASGYDFPHYERESWQSFVVGAAHLVRAFLEVRAAHLALLWTPLAVTPATQET